ncbi:MAG TPA: hypothetical protein VFP58_12130 [Candidatus Eisenbacteria bacterium]|nr:hypothetical protein [Candidatus Eisenbacteria bacterium]
MIQNVHLTLLMGPVVPVPVPREVVDALSSVKVVSGATDQNGFDLTFTLSSTSTLNTIMLLLPQIGPLFRVILIVTMGGMPKTLIDGVVVEHSVSPDVESGRTTLTLRGRDLTTVMGLIEFTGLPYPAMPPEARVALIIAKYAMYGLIPLVIPSLFTDVPNPVEKIPVHQGTDLEYVRELARQAGYVFYITPGPVPGTNVAYWGPEIKIGIPQPALNVNMDAHTNVERLSFSLNGARGTLPIVYVQIKETKTAIPVPIPAVDILNPPLGIIPVSQPNIEFLDDTAKMSFAQAIATGLSRASLSVDAVEGTGSLDVLRYGRILEARGLVGVRGAGQAFDGLYYVKSVTHDLKRGEYKQSFSLTRNGLVSITPKVPV